MLSGFGKIAQGLGVLFCSRPIYAVCRLARLDPRVATMILDELFVPIRNASSENTVVEWLHSSGIRVASIRPIVHAQFGDVELPVDPRTAWLHRVLPKNGIISLAVRTAES